MHEANRLLLKEYYTHTLYESKSVYFCIVLIYRTVNLSPLHLVTSQ